MSDKQTDMCTCGHTRAAHFEAKNQECSLGDCICAAFDKVDPVRQAAPELLKALEAIECPDCEHPLGLHADKYGCEFERGDRQVQEVGSVAMGPCGCRGIMLSDDLKACLAAIRKARGEE